jgi:hypothetical protein
MEVNLVADFISETGASETDAISCLKTWGWDLKKALIDYNGTQLQLFYFRFHFQL